jgi:putative flippase GtrA
MIKKLKNFKLLSGDSTFSQLFRTYIVGGFNLVFGLGISYLFQFFVLNSIEIPLRTYLTNIFTFSIGVIVSYFLSRRIIFKLSINDGGFKEFIKFLITNLINLVVPLFIWFLIDMLRPSIQNNEIQFLIATVLIHGFILPIKYLIYKLFVFNDSLNN